MGAALASLTGYGRPTTPPSDDGQVPTYGTDFAFVAWATAGDVKSAGVAGGQTIIGGTNAGDDLTLRGNTGTDGDVLVEASNVVLDNNCGLKIKSTTGTSRDVVKLNTSNQVEFNAIDGGGAFVFKTLGGITSATITSNSLVLPGGTAAIPGLRFQGDTSTGMFFVASNTIGVSVGGIESFRVGSAGFGVRFLDFATHIAAWGTAPGSRDVALARSAAGVLKVTSGANGGGSGAGAAPLAQFDARSANFTTAARPAAGNAGRYIYDSDLGKIILDNGSSWVNVDGSSL